MLKENSQQAKDVANWLSDGKTYKSHGKVIDYVEAKNVLKLNAEPINPYSELCIGSENYMLDLPYS